MQSFLLLFSNVQVYSDNEKHRILINALNYLVSNTCLVKVSTAPLKPNLPVPKLHVPVSNIHVRIQDMAVLKIEVNYLLSSYIRASDLLVEYSLLLPQ